MHVMWDVFIHRPSASKMWVCDGSFEKEQEAIEHAKECFREGFMVRIEYDERETRTPKITEYPA